MSISQVNYGELSKYVTLKEYFPEKKVKRILWFFDEENDLQELREELNYENLSDYVKNKDFFQNLKSKQNEIDEILINRLNEEVDKEDDNMRELGEEFAEDIENIKFEIINK